MPPKPPSEYAGASLQAMKSYLRRNRDALPVEGVVLDFWKLDKLRLPSRQGTVGLRQAPCRSCGAGGEQRQRGALPSLRALHSRRNGEIAACKASGKVSHDKKNPPRGSGRMTHREPFCPGRPGGMDATLADVFQPALPETECGPIFVASYDDMISQQTDVFALELTEGEHARHWKDRTASEVWRLSRALWKYAQQPGRRGLEPLRMRGQR